MNPLILLKHWKEVGLHCLCTFGVFLLHSLKTVLWSVSNTSDMKKSFSLQIEKLTVDLQNLIIDTEHLVG